MKFPISPISKSIKYLGLLSKINPALPVYKNDSKIITQYSPNPNRNEPKT